jgi:DNA-binding transcriptional LysR family regulator
MDQLGAVRAFIRVVETGSFTKASDSLELPRNSVTKLIQALEARLQVRLLNRTTRRVSVTNDGAAYYERMSRILEEWQEAESELTSARTRLRGILRVDMASALATQLVIPSLPAFLRRYPGLQLDLGASDRFAELISDRVDCAVRAGRITDPSLIARHIGDLPFVLCATKAYVARHGKPKHPADLERGHTMVRYFFAGSGRKQPIVLRAGDSEVTVQSRYDVAVNDGNALLAAGLAGLGVLHTLALIAQPHIAEGRLVPLLEEWTAEPVPISIIYSPTRHLSARVRVFVDWMVQLFNAHPQTRSAKQRGAKRP